MVSVARRMVICGFRTFERSPGIARSKVGVPGARARGQNEQFTVERVPIQASVHTGAGGVVWAGFSRKKVPLLLVGKIFCQNFQNVLCRVAILVRHSTFAGVAKLGPT